MNWLGTIASFMNRFFNFSFPWEPSDIKPIFAPTTTRDGNIDSDRPFD